MSSPHKPRNYYNTKIKLILLICQSNQHYNFCHKNTYIVSLMCLFLPSVNGVNWNLKFVIGSNTWWLTCAHRKHLFKVSAITHCWKTRYFSIIQKTMGSNTEYCFLKQAELPFNVILLVWEWWNCGIPYFLCSSKSITRCLKIVKSVHLKLDSLCFKDKLCYRQLCNTSNKVQILITFK